MTVLLIIFIIFDKPHRFSAFFCSMNKRPGDQEQYEPDDKDDQKCFHFSSCSSNSTKGESFPTRRNLPFSISYVQSVRATKRSPESYSVSDLKVIDAVDDETVNKDMNTTDDVQ